MDLFWKKVKAYSALPEMRLFWISLPIFATLLGIGFFYLPSQYFYVTLCLFILLGAVILTNNLRLARSNLEVKVERNELRSIIDNLRDGIIAYDTDFKVLILNRATEAIFNVRGTDIVGKIFSPNSSKNMGSATMAQAMFPSLAPMAINRSEPNDPVQIMDLSFENPPLELRVTSAKIIDPANKLLGFLKIFTDRTRELEMLRSKSEFISTAAHQLRTPLNAISWTFETLEKEAAISDAGKEFVANGSKAALRVLKIVNDLLDISKIESGRFGYQFENIELVSFFETVLKDAVSFAGKYGINIYFEKPNEPSIVIAADAQKLSMAINNIIDNGIKYNVKNGSVTLGMRLLKDTPYVEINVTDTGVGIPPGEIGRVFEKFFRAENVIKIDTEGSGFGLYIAKNIIERHGGKIGVESELNRGTTITFTLPTDPKLIRTKEVIAYD